MCLKSITEQSKQCLKKDQIAKTFKLICKQESSV